MRRRIDFWLDDTRPDDKRVLKRVETLKSKRSFRRMVMDGIMVMSALGKGDITLLLKLHPWIVDRILTTYAPKTEPPSTPSGGDLQRLIETSVQSSVTQAIMNMPSLPATTPVAAPLKPSNNTIGQGVSFTLPLVDDDDETDAPTIKLTKIAKPETVDGEPTETQSAVTNTLAQMFSMEKDDRADRLYEERLAAGLIDPRTGRLREGASRSIQLD